MVWHGPNLVPSPYHSFQNVNCLQACLFYKTIYFLKQIYYCPHKRCVVVDTWDSFGTKSITTFCNTMLSCWNSDFKTELFSSDDWWILCTTYTLLANWVDLSALEFEEFFIDLCSTLKTDHELRESSMLDFKLSN